MRLPETQLLQQLVAFADCGTLSAAAAQLHLTQPALSRSMQRLEDTLGLQLFTRCHNHITLNDNGRLAVELSRRLLDDLQALCERLREFDRSQRLIMVGGCSPIPLLSLQQQLGSCYPGFNVAVSIDTDAALLSDLADQRIDLAVLHQLPAEEQRKRLNLCRCGSEQLFVSLPPDHRLAARTSVSFEDLAGEKFLIYARVGFWQEIHKLIPDVSFITLPERALFNELARETALPSFTTDVMMRHGHSRPRMIHLPISDAAAQVTYYCACDLSRRDRFEALFQQLGAGQRDKAQLTVSPDWAAALEASGMPPAP